jgi:hypothetical protein
MFDDNANVDVDDDFFIVDVDDTLDIFDDNDLAVVCVDGFFRVDVDVDVDSLGDVLIDIEIDVLSLMMKIFLATFSMIVPLSPIAL